MASLDPGVTGRRRARKAARPQKAPEPALTLSIPAAGKKYFGLSRNGSYDAADRGEIPTIKIGRKRFVPVRALERMLDAAGKTAA
jgi:hypothetical protein